MTPKTRANAETALAVGLLVVALAGLMFLLGSLPRVRPRRVTPTPGRADVRVEVVLNELRRHEQAEAARYQAQQETRWVCFYEPGLQGMVCRVFD